MSALCIVTTSDEIVIATDGGSFHVDGALAGVGSKVLILPEASAVLTGRGPHHVIADLDSAVRSVMSRFDFDRLLGALPDYIRRATDRSVNAACELSPMNRHLEMYIAGWSESRQAHEAWMIPNFDDEGSKAFVPVRLPECYLDEVPPKTAEVFGLRMPATGECQWRRDPFKYAALNIAALRFCPSKQREDETDEWVSVGGFVQVTRVSRHAVASEIVMEWSDPIGLRIDAHACLKGLDGSAWAERVFGPMGKWEDGHAR